ncbi:MAG TPA: hypothetical protein DCP75_01230 [Haliea salexigens]|uniref:Uncharacterized protein n=1 Tax=Haliea salexigens TaxID=287487 RepID=A0A3C1KIC3_9GAMM|nr:hypothetical protein [Haliea sp.]HAN26361.1 hypothetical protein [Haliea salexigens]
MSQAVKCLRTTKTPEHIRTQNNSKAPLNGLVGAFRLELTSVIYTVFAMPFDRLTLKMMDDGKVLIGKP